MQNKDMEIICIFSGTALIDNPTKYAFGKDSALITRSITDLKNFKRVTSGYPLIMGRKTYESLGSKDLPNRRSLVISTNSTNIPNSHKDLKSAIDYARDISKSDKVFIIGGAGIIEEAMQNYATSAHITIFENKVHSDNVDVFLDYITLWPKNSCLEHEVYQEECLVFGEPKMCKLHIFKHKFIGELIKENPEALELEVLTSSDDEDNSSSIINIDNNVIYDDIMLHDPSDTNQ